MTMMVGRELAFKSLATRRVKLEPEEPNPVTCRRVGFAAGTTDLAFSDLVPMHLSSQGMLSATEAAAGISTARLVPVTAAIAT